MVDVVYFYSETAEPAVAVEPIVPDDKMKKDKVKEKNSDDWRDELSKTLDRKRKERNRTVNDEPLLPLFKERDGTAGDGTVSEPLLQERDGTASDGTVNDEPSDGKEHDGTAGDGTNNDSKEITKKRKKKSSDSDSDGGKERGTKKRKTKRR